MASSAVHVERKPSWLAISYGCCASPYYDSVRDSRELLRANGETEMKICYEQPSIVPPPRAEPMVARPSTSHSMGRHISQWMSSSRDFSTRTSTRVSMDTLRKPRKSLSSPRPSIGRPMDFRHCDGVEGIQSMVDEAPMPIRRRRSFTPLQLSIYCPEGRLSPLPDFSEDNWVEMQKPAHALLRHRDSLMSTPSHRIQRKPVGSGSRRSSVNSESSLPASLTLSALPLLPEEIVSRSDSSVSRPTLQRASTQGSSASSNRILSRLPSPSRLRSNTAPSSASSLRRVNMDVDEAIRELNTIVEERRADAYRTQNQTFANINRPPPSPSHHVPAIAPSLRVHVRSETLSDIGSAFSVPLTNKSLPTSPQPSTLSRHPSKLSITTAVRKTPTPTPRIRTTIGPLTSNPITPPTPGTATPTTPLARIGAWIKRSLPTTPATPKSSAPPSPFYRCQPPLPISEPVHTFSSPRPSTSGSCTLAMTTATHTRQTSAETATVTLLNDSETSISSTPSLSSRSPSPELGPGASPPTPGRFATSFKPHSPSATTKSRKRVPAPLVLRKEINVHVPVVVEKDGDVDGESFVTARSVSSLAPSLAKRGSGYAPPRSPGVGLLRMQGLERTVRGGEVEETPLSAVGVAF